MPAPGAARPAGLARFLDALPPDLARSFSESQLRAIELHFGMRHRIGHLVDWRRRLGIGRLRLYVVLLIGRDRHDA